MPRLKKSTLLGLVTLLGVVSGLAACDNGDRKVCSPNSAGQTVCIHVDSNGHAY